MRDYGKVAPTFWTRGSGKELRGQPASQVLALYLMTSPASSMLGLYYLPLPVAMHETGLPEPQIRGAFRVLARVGIAEYDEASEVVWVPKMARFQIGEELKPGDKRIKGILRELGAHRGHPFVDAFVERYREVFCLGLEAPSKALPRSSEPPSKALRSQDQDQDQEQDQEQEGTHPAGAREEHEARPESAREPPPHDVDLGPDGDRVLAALRATRHYARQADVELVLMLEGRRIAKGKSIAAVVEAIAEADADGVDGEYPEEARKRLRKYVENAREPGEAPRRESRRWTPTPAAARVIELFREIYPRSRRGYGAYASNAKHDGPAAEAMALEARRLATARAAAVGGDVDALEREILAHWIRAYLRDNGNPPRFDPAGRKHPLSMLTSFAEYKLPWRDAERRSNSPEKLDGSMPPPRSDVRLVGPPPEVAAFARPARAEAPREGTGS